MKTFLELTRKYCLFSNWTWFWFYNCGFFALQANWFQTCLEQENLMQLLPPPSMVKTQIYRSCEAVIGVWKVRGKNCLKFYWWSRLKMHQKFHPLLQSDSALGDVDNGTGTGKKCLVNSHPKPQHFIVIHRRKTNYFLQIKFFSLPLKSLANFRMKKRSFVRNNSL